MPVSIAERPPAPDERRRNFIAATALGVAGATLAVALTVALWPPVHPSGSLSDIPPIPTVTPPETLPDDPLASTSPPLDASTPSVGPSSPSPKPAGPSASSAPPAAPVTQAPPRLAPVSYEAESRVNTLRGNTTTRNVRDASGGRVVSQIGRGWDNTLRFNRIDAPEDGTYTLTIFYISGDGDRTATIRVDDQMIGRVRFPGTGDWYTVRSLTIQITLYAGNDNAIEFGNPDGPAPNIDRLILES